MTEQAEALEAIRAICLAFPEASERLSHGSPAFYAGAKRQFVQTWLLGHHDHTFPHLWCAAPEGVQAHLVSSDPGRFFRPPYVGHRGWIGVRLDHDVAWSEVAELCEDAYRAVASKSLIERLDVERG